MDVRWKSIFNKFYLFSCVVATIALITNCFRNFWLDKDTSQITFKTYSTNKDSIYPSLSICFDWPFRNGDLNHSGGGIDAISYSKFLSGSFWDTSFLNIDYDAVTVDLESYISSINICYSNGGEKVYNYRNKNGLNSIDDLLPIMISSQSSDEKCFTIDLPETKNGTIKGLEIKIKSQIFKDIEAPGLLKVLKGNFYVAFHYPSQFLTSSIRSSIVRYNIDSVHAESGKSGPLNKIRFNIDHVEVLRRRNKRSEPCHTSWKEDSDEVFKRSLMEKVDCKPPHWKTNKLELKNCSTQQQLSIFDNKFHDKIPMLDLSMKPCLTIEKMFYRSDEIRQSRYLSLNTWMSIVVEFEDPIYKEIEYVEGTQYKLVKFSIQCQNIFLT